MKHSVICKHYLKDRLLKAKRDRLFIFGIGSLRRELLLKTHDPKKVRHLSKEWMLALVSCSYYWPKMENNVKAYVKTYIVCQLDKFDRRKEKRLL